MGGGPVSSLAENDTGMKAGVRNTLDGSTLLPDPPNGPGGRDGAVSTYMRSSLCVISLYCLSASLSSVEGDSGSWSCQPA